MSLFPGISRAQQTDTRAPEVIEAGRLRDSGKFVEAVDLLRKHRVEYPNDGDAIRMMAETLYWLKDFVAAKALYDSAVVLHPDDVELRRQYDRFTAETTGTAITADNAEGAEKTGIAGIEGKAGQAGNTTEEKFPSSWISLRLGGLHDDQPLNRGGGGVEGGYYLAPSISAKASGGSDFYREMSKTDVSGLDADLVTIHGSIGVAGYSLSTRTDFSIEGGFIQRNKPSGMDWTGLAAFGVKPHPFVRLGVRAERAAYLYTAASLRTSVMTESYGGSVDVDGKGWLGRAVYQLQEFPDDNSGTSAYAWAMAPLLNTSNALLQGGYSMSYQDTRELRFDLNAPIDLTGVSIPGHYTPYYTPQNIIVHSIIAAFTVTAANGFVGRLGGSFGVHATEDAPMIMGGRADEPLILSLLRGAFIRGMRTHRSRNGCRVSQPSMQASSI